MPHKPTYEELEKRVKELENRIKESPDSEFYIMSGSKETGAVRRSSIDLTRALAEMRKS